MNLANVLGLYFPNSLKIDQRATLSGSEELAPDTETWSTFSFAGEAPTGTGRHEFSATWEP